MKVESSKPTPSALGFSTSESRARVNVTPHLPETSNTSTNRTGKQPRGAAQAPEETRRSRRVILSVGSLVIIALVSLLCCALVLAVLVGPYFGFWVVLTMSLIWGAVPSLVLAFCVGAPLSILLRSVRNQWLHVAAFFGLGAVLGLVFTAVTAGPAPRPDYFWTFAATASLTLAGALAVGRLAVWRMARVDPAA